MKAHTPRRISILRRISVLRELLGCYRAGLFNDAKGMVDFHNHLLEVIATHLGADPAGMRILELGCGQTAVQTALFGADGADVTGIDIQAPTFKMNLTVLARVLRTGGIERAVKSVLRHVLFDRKTFAQLSRHYGGRVSHQRLDVRVMDASRLKFPDDCFDFVFSVFVFEHVADVAAALAELRRVLKPSGVAWINVHLFTSLSGGHNFEWIRADEAPSQKVPPWDHLLDDTFPTGVYLNKLRLARWREFFSECLEVCSEEMLTEGEGILTPELAETLKRKGYTREELLTREVIFIARKRTGPG